ncbi:MAG: hypothetical protein HY763_17190 [Planctomycetes bacterium]|nr:hypothetical protein [Planctomycetota bacterium]
MSTLTKVFTVLLVVFSIAFTVMTVSIVAQTTNWKHTAERYQEHAQIADTNLRNLIAANAAELATLNETIRSHVAKVGDLETKLQDKGKELSELRSELNRSASEKSSAEAINRGLLAQLDSSEKARSEYRQQRDDLERSNIRLETQNIELNDRVNELTARVAVMQEQKRQFEQQINILRAENQKLTGGGRAASRAPSLEEATSVSVGAVTAATPVAATPIRGTVVDVSGEIVTISVGAADGVQKDMVFVVHRGDHYLGDLKINIVDPNQAAGRPSGAVFRPRPGDQVTDAAGLATPRG